MAKKDPVKWANFGWQGIRLRVPEDWNLGKIDGDRDSGYVRLDDAEIVRAEIEWRKVRGRPGETVGALVDRYIENLEKKAKKSKMAFSSQRRDRFLRDKRWLEGRDYEAFTWEADFRAYNLALKASNGRILLLRLLFRLNEKPLDLVEKVFRSLQDCLDEEEWFWSVYGLECSIPAAFKLESHELKSGHIQLSFLREKETCRVQRLSMAQMLLKKRELVEWYPVFFKKQLRDMDVELTADEVMGHPGLQVAGRPRSRWRQLLRPLPFINPRPRLYMDSRIWHCQETNKICIVDHLFRRREEQGDLAERVTHGYICHQEKTEAEPGNHAQFKAGPQ